MMGTIVTGSMYVKNTSITIGEHIAASVDKVARGINSGLRVDIFDDHDSIKNIIDHEIAKYPENTLAVLEDEWSFIVVGTKNAEQLDPIDAVVLQGMSKNG